KADAEPVTLDLRHMPDQAVQGQCRGESAASLELLGIETGAFHQQGLPMKVEPGLEHGAFIGDTRPRWTDNLRSSPGHTTPPFIGWGYKTCTRSMPFLIGLQAA